MREANELDVYFAAVLYMYMGKLGVQAHIACMDGDNARTVRVEDGQTGCLGDAVLQVSEVQNCPQQKPN